MAFEIWFYENYERLRRKPLAKTLKKLSKDFEKNTKKLWSTRRVQTFSYCDTDTNAAAFDIYILFFEQLEKP